MKLMSFALLALLGFAIGCSSLPGGSLPLPSLGAAPSDGWTNRCSQVPQHVAGAGVSYCVSQTGPNPVGTIWYFHGLLSSEKYFLSPGVLLDSSALAMSSSLSPPNKAYWIVSFSFAPGWELTDYPNRQLFPSNATLPNFQKLIDWVQSAYKISRPYYAMGISEGGANVSVVCPVLKQASGAQFFDKCVLIDAMIEKCDIYAIWGPNVCPVSVLGPTLVNQGNYPDSTTFNAGAAWGRLQAAQAMPPSYVVGCPQDMWGLYPQDQQYAADSKAKGFSVVWDSTPTPCQHATYLSQPIINFLQGP